MSGTCRVIGFETFAQVLHEPKIEGGLDMFDAFGMHDLPPLTTKRSAPHRRMLRSVFGEGLSRSQSKDDCKNDGTTCTSTSTSTRGLNIVEPMTLEERKRVELLLLGNEQTIEQSFHPSLPEWSRTKHRLASHLLRSLPSLALQGGYVRDTIFLNKQPRDLDFRMNNHQYQHLYNHSYLHSPMQLTPFDVKDAVQLWCFRRSECTLSHPVCLNLGGACTGLSILVCPWSNNVTTNKTAYNIDCKPIRHRNAQQHTSIPFLVEIWPSPPELPYFFLNGLTLSNKSGVGVVKSREFTIQDAIEDARSRRMRRSNKKWSNSTSIHERLFKFVVERNFDYLPTALWRSPMEKNEDNTTGSTSTSSSGANSLRSKGISSVVATSTEANTFLHKSTLHKSTWNSLLHHSKSSELREATPNMRRILTMGDYASYEHGPQYAEPTSSGTSSGTSSRHIPPPPPKCTKKDFITPNMDRFAPTYTNWTGKNYSYRQCRTLHLDVEHSDDNGTSRQRIVLPHNTPVGDQYGEHMTVDRGRCHLAGLTCLDGTTCPDAWVSDKHCLSENNTVKVHKLDMCKATDQISMMEPQFGGEPVSSQTERSPKNIVSRKTIYFDPDFQNGVQVQVQINVQPLVKYSVKVNFVLPTQGGQVQKFGTVSLQHESTENDFRLSVQQLQSPKQYESTTCATFEGEQITSLMPKRKASTTCKDDGKVFDLHNKLTWPASPESKRMVVASTNGIIILNARYYNRKDIADKFPSTPIIGESCFDLTNNGTTVQSNAAAVIELTPVPKFTCSHTPTYSLSSNCCYDDAVLALGRILAGSITSEQRCNDELAAHEDLRTKKQHYLHHEDLRRMLEKELQSTGALLQACLKKQISDGVNIPCYKLRDDGTAAKTKTAATASEADSWKDKIWLYQPKSNFSTCRRCAHGKVMMARVVDFPDTILYPDMAGDNESVSGWSPYSIPMGVELYWYERNKCPSLVSAGYLQYPEIELPRYNREGYNKGSGWTSGSKFLNPLVRLWPTKVLPGSVNRYRQDGFAATGESISTSVNMVSGTDRCSSVVVCCWVCCTSAIVALAFAATF